MRFNHFIYFFYFQNQHESNVTNPINIDDGKEENKEKNKEEPKSKKRSIAWEHFEVLEGCEVGNEKAKCKYCKVVMGCNIRKNGTGSMVNHLRNICVRSPLRINKDKKQKTLEFVALTKEEREKNESATHNLQTHSFNQERLRKKIAIMCIKDNQPFRIVEHEGFRELMSDAEPRFKMPSRWTIARDCLKIYKEEVVKLKHSVTSQRVSLTTDTWTSVQNINYMCLTAHWVNDDWKLCKRILNFCQIGSHKGVAIGKLVHALLTKWGIERVFTITVDNVSSNDTAISFLKKFLRGPEAILENKYIHLRCCAHILNLVVKDGLKDQHVSITRIRNAVRYVRSSPARLAKFKNCVEREKIKSEKMVCLDVETRWNSTYMMLEIAVKYEGAFDRMLIEDPNYEGFFKHDEEAAWEDNTRRRKSKKKMVEGHPESNDFENVKCFIKFLKIFYDVTIKISGSKYCTSNLFFIELVKMQEAIMKLCSSGDLLMSDMAKKMKEKYDKYWDNLDNSNFLLYVSVILDLRYKMHYLEFCFARLYGKGSPKTILMCEKVIKTLQEMFDYYKDDNGGGISSTSNVNIGGDLDDDFEKYMQEQVEGGRGKTEIDIYLVDGREKIGENFDVLGWWKMNSMKFPILSKIARHILGMPISTVASEAAFSTGGRTIDAYRSSLSPRTAEALICTQDWLRNSQMFVDLQEQPEELQQFENIEKGCTF